MKTSMIIAIGLLMLGAFAQKPTMPFAQLKNLDGATVNTAEIFSLDEITLLVFWRSEDGKCCENLDQMHEAWNEQLKHKNVRLVAVCVDARGSYSHVKPMVKGRGWEFDAYIDLNGDFRRSMGVNLLPCTMLLDEKLNVICRHDGYCTGAADMICEKVEGYLAGDGISYE
jgi:cytochrome c biogenesis protein CcmG, thiol:disulfide interchange protein DsbE